MIKKQTAHKIFPAILLVAAIAFTFSACKEQKPPEDTTKKTVQKESFQETAAFEEAVAALQLQADYANRLSEWTEKRNAVTDIGEMLKDMLNAGYAGLLTNDTFNSDGFFVTITAYPLQQGMIKKVTYTLANNDDSAESRESRFFLQYIGENSFFSDIEYVYTNDSQPEEDAFQVFENEDGCFIFLLSSGNEYTVFSANKKVDGYYTTIYMPKEKEFYVEQNVVIPLKVLSGRKFQLVQQDGVIKGVMPDYQGQPECIFNASELSFHLSDATLKSAPVDYDLPGLLLGLSDTSGNIRTLFIHKQNDQIQADTYDGQIIIPQQNSLFSIKPYVLYEDFYDNEFGNEEPYRTGNRNIRKLLYGPLGVDQTDDFQEIFSSPAQWSYNTISDTPLYIGKDYICYIQYYYESGGGSYSSGVSNIRFDRLDQLDNFKMDEWLQPGFEEIKLAELLYGAQAETLYKTDVTSYGDNTQPFVDFKQLSIKRNPGKWSIVLPVIQEYYHPGNGSYHKNITAFAAYDNNIPGFLSTAETPIDLNYWDYWKYWGHKDYLGFPESPVDLIQDDYSIQLLYGEDGPKEAILSIPVNIDEYIVSINFAGKDMQAAWLDALENINE